MLNEVLLIVGAIGLVMLFSPIYFLRRKTARMADADLKKIDPDDWKKQKKFGSYTRFISRLVWGGILLVIALLNIRTYDGLAGRLMIFYLVLGILLVFGGIIGFRRELSELRALK